VAVSRTDRSISGEGKALLPVRKVHKEWGNGGFHWAKEGKRTNGNRLPLGIGKRQ